MATSDETFNEVLKETLLEYYLPDEIDPRLDRTLYGQKKRKASARQGRRQHNWEKANRPKFGPLNEWEVDPKPVVPNRQRLLYG